MNSTDIPQQPPPSPGIVTSPTPPSPAQTGTTEPNLNPIYHLKWAWKMYKSRLVTYLGVVLLSWLISTPVILLVAGILVYSYFGISKGEWEYFITLLPVILVIVIALSVFWLVITSIGQLAQVISVVKSEEKIGAVQAYKEAVGKIIPFSLFVLLSGFFVTGAYFLFILPGVLFATWFSLGGYVFLAENEKGFSALARSRSYVKGYFIEVFVCFFVLGIIYIFVSYVPSVLGSLAGEDSTVDRLASLISIPISLISGPFSILYGYSIYKELKRVKPVPSQLPSRTPYLLTASAGYLLVIVLVGSIIGIIIPRVSEYLTHRKESQETRTYSGNTLYDEQIARANNTKRWSDVEVIGNALSQYRDDHNGSLPLGVQDAHIISSNGANICSDLIP